MFSVGQKVKLVREVCDDESGYFFPAGSVGAFEMFLGDQDRCTVIFDSSLGDPLDIGTTCIVMTKTAALVAA